MTIVEQPWPLVVESVVGEWGRDGTDSIGICGRDVCCVDPRVFSFHINPPPRSLRITASYIELFPDLGHLRDRVIGAGPWRRFIGRAMVINGTTGSGVSVALILVGVGLAVWQLAESVLGLLWGGGWRLRNRQSSFQGGKLVYPDLRLWYSLYAPIPIWTEKPCQSSLTNFGALSWIAPATVKY